MDAVDAIDAAASSSAPRQKVCLVGSGNWGSVIANIVGRNVLALLDFDPEVRMWVFEEMVGDKKLTEIINTDHENVKYMPGLKLPDNVVAYSDVCDVVADATVLIFVLPQQFVRSTCRTLRAAVRRDALVVSLIKGVFFEDGQLRLVSDVIAEELGLLASELRAPPPAVLMGANVASEIAKGMFSEATLACPSPVHAQRAASLFNCKKFRVAPISDTFGAELSGALKNVVALGAGLIDGLGWGSNAKAAVIRVGLHEMVAVIGRLRKHHAPRAQRAECAASAAAASTSVENSVPAKRGLASSPVKKMARVDGGSNNSGDLNLPSVGSFKNTDNKNVGSDDPSSAVVAERVQNASFKLSFAAENINGDNVMTFFESCGVGDIITTCYAGRHRLVAEAIAKTRLPVDVLEKQLLNGQKLQGTVCAQELHKILVANKWQDDFPLMETVYEIIFEGRNPEDIVSRI